MAGIENVGPAPFSSVVFKGQSALNGELINQSNAGYKTRGAYIDDADSNNAGLTGTFGVVLSTNPTAGSNGARAIGKPAGYVAMGILAYDAGIAQNEPAKSSYVLQGTPIAEVYWGSVSYKTWTNTQTGSHAVGAVLETDIIVYRALSTGTGAATIGSVEFLASGSAVPTGWAQLPGYISEIDENNRVVIQVDFKTS